MKVVKKVIFPIIAILIVLCTVGLIVYGVISPKEAKLVKLSDIHIPEKLDQDNLFGLFFYDEEGNLVPTKDGLDNVHYDPKKPTVIHIHGQQMLKGYNGYDPFYNPDGMVKAGYNYGVFLWSQLSDVSYANMAIPKIWTRNSGSFFYADENGKRTAEEEDILTYATAEVFVAYYLDFMEKAGCEASSITITGHSLGANSLFAITSYLTTLYKEKEITKEFMPDRLIYMDAFLEAYEEPDYYVPWLGKTIGKEGVVGLAKDAVDAAKEIGIATVYVKSSDFVSFMPDQEILSGGYPGLSRSLHDKMLYVDFDSGYTANPGEQHNACCYWITNTIDRLLYDATTENEELAFNYNTPISYTFARNGIRYEMEKNKTEDVNDDVFFSTNIESAKIAGFVYNDENNNGVYDERIKARLAGVTVELYEGDKIIEATTTTEAGYYEFVLPNDKKGNYTIKVKLNDGMSVAKTGKGGYMDNGIGSDGTATVHISSVYDLKIINIGLIIE